MRITVHKSGPLFDDRIEALIQQGLTEGEAKLADRGLILLRGQFRAHFRQPTGRYEGAVHAEREGTGFKITDGGVIYGPWLEGVGSRNFTTRFKGYASFRKVRQMLDAEATEIVGHEIAIKIDGA